jgi:hypothetical protein
VFILLIGLFSCQKEYDINFKMIDFNNLRTKEYNLLTFIDNPRQIIKYDDHGGWVDTLGETKLFFRGDLLAYRNWETTYMSSAHHKTDILYANCDDVVLVLIRPDYMFCDRMYVVGNNLKKEFYVTIGEIKLAEIDEGQRVIRITYNNSWTRTGPLPDEVEEFNY